MALSSNISSQIQKQAQPWLSALPFNYDNLNVFQITRPIGFRFQKHIVVIEAELGSKKLISCGEDNSIETATAKAISELIERSTLIEWTQVNSQTLRKTSNGWAAHPDEDLARISAMLELVERDAVLSQWYLAAPFVEIDPQDFPLDIKTWVHEELSRSEFPILRVLISTEGIGPAVTCLLLNNQGLGVCSHSTKIDLKESISGAISEACRAAHHALRKSYWKDTMILKENLPAAIDSGAHAVYYAYQEPFPSWMFGDKYSWEKANKIWKERISKVLQRKDEFSFTTVLESPVFVGFATHPECLDLEWGTTSSENFFKKVSNQRIAKNLTKQTLNHKPHIIS